MADTSSAGQWARAVLDGEAHVLQGTLDLRVLDQDQIWVDETGRVHLLAEMDEPYLTNVLRLLQHRARALQRRHAIAHVCDLLDAADENLGPVDIAHITVHALDTLEQEDPATWLNCTPLATAITSRLARLRPGPAS